MKIKKKYNKGMTLPELVLAIFMMIAFTGFTVMIVQYTSRFFQPLNKEAKEEEKKFYEECKRDYKVMLETAKKHGIKNPIMEIPFEVDF